MPEDMELFACLYCKPLDKPNEKQQYLLDLINREGPLTIQQMKESSGMLVKEITPILHRFQEAFIVFEDQYDGEWDRGWFKFTEMFPNVDLKKYSHIEALKIILKRFAYRIVCFDIEMVKSYYKLPARDIKQATDELVSEGVLVGEGNRYLLKTDFEILQNYSKDIPKFVYAMHRNDILVKANEHILTNMYTHKYPDTLYYMMIDGEFCGAVVGKFRYTPEVEDVILELPNAEVMARKYEILDAIKYLSGEKNSIKRFQGEKLV